MKRVCGGGWGGGGGGGVDCHENSILLRRRALNRTTESRKRAKKKAAALPGGRRVFVPNAGSRGDQGRPSKKSGAEGGGAVFEERTIRVKASRYKTRELRE